MRPLPHPANRTQSHARNRTRNRRWQWIQQSANMTDPRMVAITAGLSPAVFRVGGITGDWTHYLVPTADEPGNGEHAPAIGGLRAPTSTPHVPCTPAPAAASSPPTGQRLGDYWPFWDANMTMAEFESLLQWANSSAVSVLFGLNELEGRDCHFNGTDTCVGPWNTTNAADFLAWIQAQGYGAPTLMGLELGNELTRGGHITVYNNTQDQAVMWHLIDDTWPASGSKPPFYAPSTDTCDGTAGQIMTAARANGFQDGFTFTYHSYPGEDGSRLMTQLVNVTWLRDSIYLHDPHANSSNCILQWSQIGKPHGTEIALTETNSGYNAYFGITDAVWNGFWYLASLGQYASTGVQFHARWSYIGGRNPNPFALVSPNGSRWDVAADYWIMALHKRTVGAGVLAAVNTAPADTDALVYAHCSAGGAAAAGSVTLLVVNPQATTVTIALTGVGSVVPRNEWVLTAPGGNLNSTSPCLNGCAAGPPLRVGEDGSLPPLPSVQVTTGPATTFTVPPLSQSFVQLPAAAASACM